MFFLLARTLGIINHNSDVNLPVERGGGNNWPPLSFSSDLGHFKIIFRIKEEIFSYCFSYNRRHLQNFGIFNFLRSSIVILILFHWFFRTRGGVKAPYSLPWSTLVNHNLIRYRDFRFLLILYDELNFYDEFTSSLKLQKKYSES